MLGFQSLGLWWQPWAVGLPFRGPFPKDRAEVHPQEPAGPGDQALDHGHADEVGEESWAQGTRASQTSIRAGRSSRERSTIANGAKAQRPVKDKGLDK